MNTISKQENRILKYLMRLKRNHNKSESHFKEINSNLSKLLHNSKDLLEIYHNDNKLTGKIKNKINNTKIESKKELILDEIKIEQVNFNELENKIKKEIKKIISISVIQHNLDSKLKLDKNESFNKDLLILDDIENVFNLVIFENNKIIKKLDDIKELLHSIKIIFSNKNSNYNQVYAILIEFNKKVNEFENESHNIINYIERAEGLVINEINKFNRSIKKIEYNFNKYDLDKLSDSDISNIILKQQNNCNGVKKFLEEQRQFKTKLNPKQLIAVHKSSYFPKKGIITTSAVANPLSDARETVHFCFNGPVSNDAGADWSHCKYAILIPAELIFNQFVGIAPQDSFTLGQVILPKGTDILIYEKFKTENERNIIKRKYEMQCKNCNIIIINAGSDFDKAIYERIQSRGYNAMRLGAWGYRAPYNENDIRTISEMNLENSDKNWEDILKPYMELVIHFYSFWKILEGIDSTIKSNIKQLKILKKWIRKDEFPPEFIESIKQTPSALLKHQVPFPGLNQLTDRYDKPTDVYLDERKKEIMDYYNKLKIRVKSIKNKESKKAYLRLSKFLKESLVLYDKEIPQYVNYVVENLKDNNLTMRQNGNYAVNIKSA